MSDFELQKYSIKKRNIRSTGLEVTPSKWVYMDVSDNQPIDWRALGIETPVQNLNQCDDPYVYAAVEEMSMGHSIRTGSS